VELALGDVLVRTRHVAEAESLFTAALKSYRTVFGPGDPRTQRTLRALANLCDGELHLPGCSARP
jgi:hypothetical protein